MGHAQKNMVGHHTHWKISFFLSPPQKFELGHKRWATHTITRGTLTIYFFSRFIGEKVAENRCIQSNNLTGFEYIFTLSLHLRSIVCWNWFFHCWIGKYEMIERHRELFNLYKEYMDELTMSLENFENSVRTVEQSLFIREYLNFEIKMFCLAWLC